jgi:hypothetical protein
MIPVHKYLKAIVIGLIFFLPVVVTAQFCGKKVTKQDVSTVKQLKGDWSGEIRSGEKVYTLHITIKQTGEELAVKIADGSATNKQLDATVSICAPAKFHFFGVLPDGQRFSYSPRLKDGVLTGSYQVGDVCSLNKPTFSLTRQM